MALLALAPEPASSALHIYVAAKTRGSFAGTIEL